MENKVNISQLEADLAEIEKRLKETITSGLELVKANPSNEKNVMSLFINPAMKVYDFFLRETERTGTQSVGKNVIKYAMFKRF